MIPLRLVVDTNVIVSAALKPDGLPRAVLLLAVTRPAVLFVSEAIFAEYLQVLRRRELKIPRGLREQFLQFLRNRSKMVEPSRALRVARDPADDKFIECAEAARADYLITGNQRHFPKYWRGTKVITPREFLDVIAPHLAQ